MMRIYVSYRVFKQLAPYVVAGPLLGGAVAAMRIDQPQVAKPAMVPCLPEQMARARSRRQAALQASMQPPDPFEQACLDLLDLLEGGGP